MQGCRQEGQCPVGCNGILILSIIPLYLNTWLRHLEVKRYYKVRAAVPLPNPFDGLEDSKAAAPIQDKVLQNGEKLFNSILGPVWGLRGPAWRGWGQAQVLAWVVWSLIWRPVQGAWGQARGSCRGLRANQVGLRVSWGVWGPTIGIYIISQKSL